MNIYEGYDCLAGSCEGAVLIFAHNSREAKKVGWNTPTFLQTICDDEYINMRVRYLKSSGFLFKEANQEKLANDEPHVIESPTCCNGCEMWGYELNKNGYCEDCAESTQQGRDKQ